MKHSEYTFGDRCDSHTRDVIVWTAILGGPGAERVTVTQRPEDLHRALVVSPRAALRLSPRGTIGPGGQVSSPLSGSPVPPPAAEGKHRPQK